LHKEDLGNGPPDIKSTSAENGRSGTDEEADSLRFQIGMSKAAGRGGRRFLPYAFTEQGVAMLSGVLNSPRAIRELMAPPAKPRRKIGFEGKDGHG
jgi:hypothetical protein